MERRAISIEDGLLESSQDFPSVKLPQRSAPFRRPYAFPRFDQAQRSNDKHEGSQPPKDHSGAPASNLAQEASEPGASPYAGEAADAALRATPLLPNPFDGPLTAGADLRMDAFRLVHLADISTRHRLRDVVDDFIPVMVDSLSTHDIIQPPVLRPDPASPGKFLLVAGRQRIHAARASGADKILCRVVELTDDDAELWEIEENLVRSPLTPAQEALAIDRRRELHEQLHGKAKARGAAAANRAMGRVHASANVADASSSFVETTAKRMGKSARSVQRVVQRAAQNGRSDLERVVGTSLDRGNELDALPMLPADTREALIKRAAAGQEVSAIRAAAEAASSPIDEGESDDSPMSSGQSRGGLTSAQPGVQRVECDESVRGMAALQAAWHEASIPARARFLVWIDETKAAPTTLEPKSFETSESEDGK
ncbi:ParB/RepB/Spo0J family partition protein [Bradyrhizobium sp. LB1.3]